MVYMFITHFFKGSITPSTSSRYGTPTLISIISLASNPLTDLLYICSMAIALSFTIAFKMPFPLQI